MVRLRKTLPVTSGFTLVEIMIVIAIIITLGAIFIVTLAGLGSKDNVDRATQAIYDDLIYIRGRAISTNRVLRLNFSSSSQWKVESQDPTTLVWSQIGDVRKMPGDTYLIPSALTNAGSNLTATPRGIYQFSGTSTINNPYVTVTSLGATRTKSINVDVGGAIDFVNN